MRVNLPIVYASNLANPAKLGNLGCFDLLKPKPKPKPRGRNPTIPTYR